MTNRSYTDEELLAAFRKHQGNVSAITREIYPNAKRPENVRRHTRDALNGLIKSGKLTREEYEGRANARMTDEELATAQDNLRRAHEAKAKKGDWRKPSYINLDWSGPFILGVFGDPHLDNPGTNPDEFIDALQHADRPGVYTCCIGDFFDNWPRALGHLYQDGNQCSDAWAVFSDAMERWPFLFSCDGNHDQFAGGVVNFLHDAMRRWGIRLNRGGGHFLIDQGTGEPIKVALRHIWRGNSMYSDAHAVVRAIMLGQVEADIVAGGHTHKGEVRSIVRPSDQRVMKAVQVSAFKEFDNYANDRGFLSAKTPPVAWLVCDAREPVTSHNRIQSFYDIECAIAMRDSLARRN